MDMFHSGEYLANNPDWHEPDSAWKVRQIAAMMDRHRLAPASVVEVGCGAGGILRELAVQRPGTRRFVGFDIASDAIALATRTPSERVEFRCADFLDRTDERFDLLLLIDVFEHVPDYMGFLRALRGRADRYIFHIPLDMTVFGLLKNLPTKRRDTVGHLHYFSKATALRTLTDTGYTIEDCVFTRTALDKAALRDSPQRQILNLSRRGLFALSPDLAVTLLGGFALMVLAR